MTILVTGSKGQLGNELQVLSKNYSQHNWIFNDVDELNIADSTAVKNFFTENKIDVCINAAAYTAVDKAETEKEICFLVNETAVKNLAIVCEENSALFFHVSTDFIFDGKKSSPYLEDDKPNPLGVYGASKLAGEKAALENCKRTILIRTSWVYSSFGKNFVKTMLQLAETKPSLGIVFDQMGTPTYAADLAQVIISIMKKNPTEKQFGVYHFSNEGAISWFDFAKSIFEIRGIKIPVSPIETWQYPTPATRPFYSVLNKKKIKDTFGIEIPYWKNSLEDCMKLIS